MESSFFEILTYFIIYSFLGWILETVFRSICEKKLINTGFLYGPFCPIYGLGAIIMYLLLNDHKGQYISIFCIAIVVLTIWEYIVGVFLEKTFKTKYWDYSDHKLNFQGRVCLINSIFWGLLGIAFINFIHPFIVQYISQIDINILKIVIYLCSILVAIDVIISVVKVSNIKSTLTKIEEINKEIKEKLKEIKDIGKTDIDKVKFISNIQNIVNKLEKKRNRTLIRLYKYVYRLKKAFPAINTKEITEILNKKILVKKHKDKK